MLEPTLSGLYQLGIDRRNIPDTMRIVLPQQMYIGMHPIAWQVKLMLSFKQSNFSFENYIEMLNLTEQSKQLMSHAELAYDILKRYQQVTNELRALITEK